MPVSAAVHRQGFPVHRSRKRYVPAAEAAAVATAVALPPELAADAAAAAAAASDPWLPPAYRQWAKTPAAHSGSDPQ